MDRIEIAQNFNISMEMLDIMCGKFIGEGNTRIVFDSILCPGYVVKIEKTPDTHHNILEYYMATSVQYQPEIAKWLAPVGFMSAHGRILMQKKVEPITNKNKKNIPVYVPAFLSDMKFANYGFIGKQFVCFDYAFSLEMCGSHAMNGKMKKFKSHLGEI